MTIPPLQQAIADFRANDLAYMLRTAGITDIPRTKDGKVQLWVRLISRQERIEAAVRQITPRCLKALQVLQARGPQAELRTSRYHSLLGRAGLLEKESRERRRPYGDNHPESADEPVTFEEILASLLLHGLIGSHTVPPGPSSKLGFEGGLFVYIPKEVAPHLPPLPESDKQSHLVIDHAIAGSSRTCQRDLYLYWSTVREAPLQLTNAGILRVGDLKRVSGQLLLSEAVTTGNKETDLRRLFFLRRILTALRLLRPGATNGDVVEAVSDPPFLQAAPAERVRQCYETWRDGAWWNELWATYEQGQTRASGNAADFAPAAVVHARQTVISTLVGLSTHKEAWVPLDDISEHLHDRDEEFLVDRETAERQGYYGYSYYQRHPSPYIYNSLGWQWQAYEVDQGAGWDHVETVFIRAVLVEGLYWLGLVDLGYAFPATQSGGTAPAGLSAVRLTAMGRWLLLGEKKPEIPAETGHVVVQPNFHIFAFDPIADSVLAHLDSFAGRLNAERAIEYEISRESIYRAQSAGMTVPEIQAWLEEVTGAPLPQNVARSLEEWQAAFERILVRPQVALLQAAAPELIASLCANPALNRAIIKQVSPTAVLVRPEQVDLLERALLSAGELPARSSRPEEGRQATITLDAEGRVHFAHRTPSLYTYAFLQPFAEQCNGAWCITAASIRRAVRQGYATTQILAELETMTLGEVPAGLRRRIKAWGGHYGNARLQRMVLLQFRDQAALDELLAEPELASHLTPFKPESRLGMAAVAEKDVSLIRQLLAERGVDITTG